MATTTGPPYTKGAVNRAGRLCAATMRAVREKDRAGLAQVDMEEFVDAIALIEWWRGEHAYPLSMASANLRWRDPLSSVRCL